MYDDTELYYNGTLLHELFAVLNDEFEHMQNYKANHTSVQ